MIALVGTIKDRKDEKINKKLSLLYRIDDNTSALNRM